MKHVRKGRMVKKTAVIDIDGVLADYYKTFGKFMKEQLQVDITKIDTNDHNLFELLSDQLGAYTFECALDGFREQGLLRTVDPFQDARYFMQEITNKYNVLVLTSRPGHNDSKVRQDTEYWFESNKIPYDELCFRHHKADHIRYRMAMGRPNFQFMVEDNAKTASEVAGVGRIRSYLMNKEYNQVMVHPDVVRVNSLQEVLDNEIK